MFVNNEKQEEFLRDLEYVRASIILKNVHDDFLKSIKEDNRSEAIGIIIDKYMKMTKRQIIEKYLLYIVFILCIFTASTLFLNMI